MEYSSKKNFIPLFIVTMLYTFVCIVYTHPLASDLSHSIIGKANSDAVQYSWNAYILKKNIGEGTSLFSTSQIFYPAKADLLFHTYTPLMSIAALGSNDPTLAINLFLIISFVLSAVGGWLLARRYLRSEILSFAVGFIFAFSPYKLLRLDGHYNLVLTATIPFFILCFLNTFTFEKRNWIPKIISWKYFVLCFALGIVSLLSDYYTTFFLLYFVLFYYIYQVFFRDRFNYRSYKTWGVITLIFAGAHLLARLLRVWGADDRGAFWWGGDLLAYFIPNRNSILYGDWSESLMKGILERSSTTHTQQFGSPEFQLFLGYTMIVCAIVLLIHIIRDGLENRLYPFAFVLLVFFLISLPSFKIGGIAILHPPTALLHYIPLFNNLRCPARIEVMIELLLPLLAFAVIETKWQAYKKIVQVSIALFLLIVVMVEFQPTPYNTTRTDQMPAVYSMLDDRVKVLMPVPFGVRDGMQEIGKVRGADLLYQIKHDKKIMGGYISRVDPEIFELYQSDSICKQLLHSFKNPSQAIPLPAKDEVDLFFQKFSPDAVVISPRFRNSACEKYIAQITAGKIRKKIEKEGYLLLLLY